MEKSFKTDRTNMKKTTKSKIVAKDFARLMQSAAEVKSSEFVKVIVSNI